MLGSLPLQFALIGCIARSQHWQGQPPIAALETDAFETWLQVDQLLLASTNNFLGFTADTHCKLHLYVARCQHFMRCEALPILNVRLYRTEAQTYA
eukprot:5369197-Amphidinium_carterae.1